MDSDLVEFLAFVGLAGGILALIVNCILAIAVFADGRRIASAGGRLFLVGPTLWSIVIFFTGVAGLALYWLCHYSTLVASKSEIH